jgi:hypothetical protein
VTESTETLPTVPGSLLLVLAAATLVGCGGKAPPAVATVESPPAAAGVHDDPAAPIAGRVLGTAIHTKDAEELRYVVLQELTDRYAAAQGITVTQAEKEAYVAQLREALGKDPATASRIGEESAEDQAARLEIAEAFIRQWKVNRALQRQYGGRVIFQQGGPEPLDAYRRFLEERQAAGDFAIDDAPLKTEFWRYYEDDSIHSFIEPGSAEEAKAFEVEPWASGTHSG